MDHLPVPHSKSGERVRVRYLCSEPYDEDDFLLYPERAGWASIVEQIKQRNDAGGYFANAEEVTKFEDFAQRWLFFGLLHAFLGHHYNESDFVVHTGSDTWVSTENFGAILKQWAVDVERSDVAPRKVLTDRLLPCLLQVSAIVSRVFTVFRFLQRPGMSMSRSYLPERLRDSKALWTSILAIGETLTFALAVICQVKDIPSSIWRSLYDHDWDLRNEPGWRPKTEREMLKNGWCPSRVSQVPSQISSLAAAHFLGNLNSPDEGQQHDKCSSLRCLHSQIDIANYEPVHLGHCGCQLRGWQDDGAGLTQALEDGTYPVMHIKGASLDDLVVEAEPASISVPYVAVSHVWADGLGNPGANQLPVCRLFQLRDVVAKLDGAQVWEQDPIKSAGLRVWCDTMCVPPHNPTAGDKYQELRNAAMLRMRRVYEQAAYVLILDHTILKYSLADIGPLEAAMRFCASPWMGRLWTLQEVLLAKTPLIQFADSAVDMRDLWNRTRGLRLQNVMHQALSDTLDSQFRRLRALNVHHSTFARRFIEICSPLFVRQVTVPSDEGICIATLLDLEVSKVLEAEDEQKMAVVWGMIGAVPSSIPQAIIFHGLPRLREARLSWAPRSLLAPNEPTSFMNHLGSYLHPALRRPELCTQLGHEGLHVTFCAWRMTFNGPPASLQPYEITSCEAYLAQQENRLLIRDEAGRWFRAQDAAAFGSSPREEHATFRRARGPFILLRQQSRELSPPCKGLACYPLPNETPDGYVVKPFACILYNDDNENEQQLWSAAYDKACALRQAGKHPRWLQIMLDPRNHKPLHGKTAEESLRALLRTDGAHRSVKTQQHNPTATPPPSAEPATHDPSTGDKPRKLMLHGLDLVDYEEDIVEHAMTIQKHSRKAAPVYDFVMRVLTLYIGQYFEVTQTFDETSRWIVS